MIDETLWWTARADRLLSQAGGSLLFAGRPGVGRRNIISLCCALLRMAPYQLSMTKDYSLKAFKAELKHVLHVAGVQNEEICLILEVCMLPTFSQFFLKFFCESFWSFLANKCIFFLQFPRSGMLVFKVLQKRVLH